MPTIRRVRADEWVALRDLRLRAFAGAPDAFGTTLASAQRRSDAEWQEAARRGETGDPWATFVAEDGGEMVGMASGLRDDSGVYELLQMWVEPRVRRRGVGSDLVRAVIGWAAGLGAALVRLAVSPANPSAVALYRSLGFRDTGRREPDLFDGRSGLAMIMERELST